MTFTHRTALVAAGLGALLVYAVALFVAPTGQTLLWHALVPMGGAVVGVVDLFLLSLLSRRRG